MALRKFNVYGTEYEADIPDDATDDEIEQSLLHLMKTTPPKNDSALHTEQGKVPNHLLPDQLRSDYQERLAETLKQAGARDKVHGPGGLIPDARPNASSLSGFLPGGLLTKALNMATVESPGDLAAAGVGSGAGKIANMLRAAGGGGKGAAAKRVIQSMLEGGATGLAAETARGVGNGQAPQLSPVQTGVDMALPAIAEGTLGYMVARNPQVRARQALRSLLGSKDVRVEDVEKLAPGKTAQGGVEKLLSTVSSLDDAQNAPVRQATAALRDEKVRAADVKRFKATTEEKLAKAKARFAADKEAELAKAQAEVDRLTTEGSRYKKTTPGLQASNAAALASAKKRYAALKAEESNKAIDAFQGNLTAQDRVLADAKRQEVVLTQEIGRLNESIKASPAVQQNIRELANTAGVKGASGFLEKISAETPENVKAYVDFATRHGHNLKDVRTAYAENLAKKVFLNPENASNAAEAINDPNFFQRTAALFGGGEAGKQEAVRFRQFLEDVHSIRRKGAGPLGTVKRVFENRLANSAAMIGSGAFIATRDAANLNPELYAGLAVGTGMVVGWHILVDQALKSPRYADQFHKWATMGATPDALRKLPALNKWMQKNAEPLPPTPEEESPAN